MVTHGEEFGAQAPNEAAEVTPIPEAPVYLTRREMREAEARAAKSGGATASTVVPATTTAAVVAKPQAAEHPQASKPPKAAKPPRGPKAIKSKPRVRKPEGRIGRTGRVATMVAMAFIAGLAVATSVPANALLTQSQVFAMANGQYQDGEYDVGQALQAGDATVTNGRDAVVALQWGGVLGGGLYSGATYVNNPLGKIQWPLRQTFPISDGYGIRHNPFGSGYAFHHGVDFNPPEGYPIQSIAPGVVTIAGSSASGNYGSLGQYVEIDHGMLNGHHVVSTYAHMISGSVQVKVGQHVNVGDVLGQVGCTGSCTGAHLHFQLQVDGAETDPLPWLRANAK